MQSNECRDIKELHPYVRSLAEKLVDECHKQGLNIKIGETYRTVQRQDYLYAQGRTRAGKIVTNAKGSSMSSYHQWRLAFDVFQNIKGKEYDNAFLDKVGAIGKKLGLEWGGDWISFKDKPHFQYTFGLSIADLKNGKAIPTYNKIDILLNGKQKSIEGHIQDGKTYVVLRELEDDKISIGYDSNKKMPTITIK